MTMKKVLTIAGSDCSGGAGIQADLKTITMHGMYGMSIITSLTAQNTTGVFGIMDTSKEMVEKQLDAVFTDIVPDAVKIGMVSNPEIIEVIASKLIKYHATNIVLDPVMVATSGSRLISVEAVDVLVTRLFPLSTVITPNIPEAECLTDSSIKRTEDMERAAEELSSKYACATLVKGGHSTETARDVLYNRGNITWFTSDRILNPNTHGTGCTLSSAIACGLAKGITLEESIAAAKEYLTGALRSGLNIGRGSGPLNHMYEINCIK